MSSSEERRARIREYKETPRRAGMYVVRNSVNGKWLVGASPDVPAMLNRQRSQLDWGGHPDKELQLDWNDSGPAAFEFDVLDELKPSGEPGEDVGEDLRVLKHLWIERLEATGQALYPSSRRGT